jgi:hypothetical protein
MEYKASFEDNRLGEDEYIDFRSFHNVLTEKYKGKKKAEMGITLKIMEYLENAVEYIIDEDLDKIVNIAALDINDKPDIFQTGFLQLIFDDSYIHDWLILLAEKKLKRIPHNTITITYLFWTIFIYYLLSQKIYIETDKHKKLPFIYDYRMHSIMPELCFRSAQMMQSAIKDAKELPRLMRSKNSLNAKMTLRHKEVIKFYNEIDPYGRKPYAIAELIHREMSKKMQEVPTVRTIREDLKRLGLC